MAQKIKNFFLNLKWNKKRLIPTSPLPKRRLWFDTRAFAFVPVLIFLGIAAVSGAFLTSFGQTILGGTIGNLTLAIVVAILQIPLLLANVFLSMSIAILGVVTSPGFISLSYTNPAGNEFLAVGWALTRDLANIGFVIILVIIGLATALKIREYQWQKTLPLLIGIALLINFTPVILGLIVDASNIMMHFFLGDMVDFTFVATIWHEQLNILLDSAAWSRDLSFLPFAQSLFLIVFGFISGFIFFLFSFLFILRYIAIWMLVILSPIAFFCYILPATRDLFKTWWNQFIQWSIIGVSAAFFLWLSSQLLLLSWEGKVMGGTFDTGEKATAPIAEMMNQLLPYSIGIGFLIAGFFVALTTSAMGATGIITATQKGAKTALAWTAKKTGRGIERGLKIPKGAERLGRWAAGKKIFGVAARPLIGYAKRRGEEEKKELEGLPFATRAKMTRKPGQSIQDSLRDVVRGLDARKFASEARPDDITLDVLRAMSMKQVTTTGDRGSSKLKNTLQDIISNNFQTLATEVNDLLAAGKTQEANNLAAKMNHIMTNTNYTT
ncbi:MAG: hypothetical protein ACKKMS_01480 [Candidatus Nealsonbacteria bacterium]